METTNSSQPLVEDGQSNASAPLTTTRGRRVNVVKADAVPTKAVAKKESAKKSDEPNVAKAPKAVKEAKEPKVAKEKETKAPKDPKAAQETKAPKDLKAAQVKAPKEPKAAKETKATKEPKEVVTKQLAPCTVCGGTTPFCALTGQPHNLKPAKPTPKKKSPIDVDEDSIISSLLAAAAGPPGVKRPRSAKPTSVDADGVVVLGDSKDAAVDVDGQPATSKKRAEKGHKTTTTVVVSVDAEEEDLPLSAFTSVETALAPAPAPKKAGSRQTTLNFTKANTAPKTEIPPPPVKPFKPIFNKSNSALAKSIFMDASLGVSTPAAADKKSAASNGGDSEVVEVTEDSVTAAAVTDDKDAAVVEGEGGVASSSAAASSTPAPKVDKVRTSRTYLSFYFDHLSERSKYEIVRDCMNKNGGSLPEKYAKMSRSTTASKSSSAAKATGSGGGSIASMLKGKSSSSTDLTAATTPLKKTTSASPAKGGGSARKASAANKASPHKVPSEDGEASMLMATTLDGEDAAGIAELMKAAPSPTKKAGPKRSRSTSKKTE